MWDTKTEALLKIHGAIMLYSSLGRIIELFQLSEMKALVFNDRAKKLTLPLQGPNEAWAFDALHGQTYVCLLKCNGADIFEAPSHDLFQEGCSVYCLLWVNFFIVEPVFPGFSREKFVGHPISRNVAFVEAKMRTMLCGLVVALEFTALRDLSLSGIIRARSCVAVHSIVLFQNNQKEKEVKVTSTGLIPLSRNMIAVDSRSSLLIRIKLSDGTTKKVLNETVHPCTS